MDTSRYSLFNAVDDTLADHIGETAFNESLVLNILFQDRVLVHEAHFFGSSLLAQHLARVETKGEPSLFELAARNGLIVPAFRDHGVQSLAAAQEAMMRDYGSSYELTHPNMLKWRKRLIAAVDEGLTHSPPFYWPSPKDESMGEGFHKIIRNFLQLEEPPSMGRRTATVVNSSRVYGR